MGMPPHHGSGMMGSQRGGYGGQGMGGGRMDYGGGHQGGAQQQTEGF